MGLSYWWVGQRDKIHILIPITQNLEIWSPLLFLFFFFEKVRISYCNFQLFLFILFLSWLKYLSWGATGRSGTPSRQSRGVDPPVQIRRVEEAPRKCCRKTSVFLSRETGMSGHFVGRIKGDKYRFELQFLKWDFSWDAVAAQGYILRWRGNHVVFLEV